VRAAERPEAGGPSAREDLVVTLGVMDLTHETLCDGKHTERQPCNRLLVLSDARPVGTETRMAAQEILASPASVLEAPLTPPNTTSPQAPSHTGDEAGSREVSVRPADLTGMPAPSPWAVRAWEDTAAAVGATASPAPPPREPELDDDAGDRRGLGHIPFVIGLAGAATLALLFARRRRK
jgi:MYXO-CTERM domain-containing protein